MGQLDELQYFGPYRLVRRLADSTMAERWLALHERALSSHVVHRFQPCPDKASQRRVMGAIEQGLALSGPHLLPIELFSRLVLPHLRRGARCDYCCVGTRGLSVGAMHQ